MREIRLANLIPASFLVLCDVDKWGVYPWEGEPALFQYIDMIDNLCISLFSSQLWYFQCLNNPKVMLFFFSSFALLVILTFSIEVTLHHCEIAQSHILHLVKMGASHLWHVFSFWEQNSTIANHGVGIISLAMILFLQLVRWFRWETCPFEGSLPKQRWWIRVVSKPFQFLDWIILS